MEFVSTRLHKDISAATVSRLMEKHGLSLKKQQTRTKGFSVDYTQLAVQYRKWVLDMRPLVFQNRHINFIASIDFTFSRHSRYAGQSYEVKSGCESHSLIYSRHEWDQCCCKIQATLTAREYVAQCS